MKSRAAVAWEAGKPLVIEEIDVEGPREGEVLVRNVATGVCHSDTKAVQSSKKLARVSPACSQGTT